MEITADVREKVKEAILEASRENRISCRAARKVASDFDVPVRFVGDLINELKIKIVSCELGCF